MTPERTDDELVEAAPQPAEQRSAAPTPTPRTTGSTRSRRSSTERVAPPTTLLPEAAPQSDPTTAERPVVEGAALSASSVTVPPAAAPTTLLPASGAQRSEARPGPVPTNVYRARRPGVAILLIIPALGVGLLLLRSLAIAAFAKTPDLGATLASVCGLVSLPLIVAGLYGLVTGAAHGAEHYGFRVWARPPLAYLIVGLAFAGTAALALH